ncbi:MAG: class I SAM-dependent methyltransferase [Deltaproteobacteria bacterium]|nr:class I SAM-dependent methyltransferase [Deltaproteobacteria bacterium]
MERQKIQDWWAENPMTYGTAHGRADYVEGSLEFGSREFFDRLDREFYSWNKPLHGERPFDRLVPYSQYRTGARVLEVGCGLGTMAMLWAQNGAGVTAVDLNGTSIAQTQRRFTLHGLSGDIRLMDAGRLDFPGESFDYAYSWGVLHHSPDLEQSLAEMMRVLKTGGGFGLMLYNRRSLLHWYRTRYLEGFLHYENHFLNPLELASRYADGDRAEGNPHTWPVTEKEIRAMLARYSQDLAVRMLGTELDTIFKYLLPGLGLLLPAWAKKPWARRFGWSLWITGHKA